MTIEFQPCEHCCPRCGSCDRCCDGQCRSSDESEPRQERWQDWPTKVAIAKDARESARKLRQGKPSSFRPGRGLIVGPPVDWRVSE